MIRITKCWMERRNRRPTWFCGWFHWTHS